MVVTVPRLGNTYLAVKALFETLEIPCVIPTSNNRVTIERGARISPEEICLPFKVMMGNYLECIKRGADTVIITGSCGPCRFGEYCELQMNLLKKLGHDIRFIVIDSPGEIGKEALFSRIGEIARESGLKRAEKIKALKQAYSILTLADDIDAYAYFFAGYEKHKGECKQILNECRAKAFECNGVSETRQVLLNYRKKIRDVELDSGKDPVKISLIGEIYSMVEPFGNMHIEEKLMDLGVSTIRHMTPSWWIRDLILKPIKLNSPEVRFNAKPYLPYPVGGHARESIAHAVMAKKESMDGIIQVFPLGCMPEIITKAILPSVRRDTGTPVMTLVMDEITGEAGYMTRIEAFIDMLEARRKNGRRTA